MPRGKWSERRDLNPRQPAPKAGALPGCATLREKRAHYSKSLGRVWRLFAKSVFVFPLFSRDWCLTEELAEIDGLLSTRVKNGTIHHLIIKAKQAFSISAKTPCFPPFYRDIRAPTPAHSFFDLAVIGKTKQSARTSSQNPSLLLYSVARDGIEPSFFALRANKLLT